ncbi:unnamed protein product [Parajaminaea phylloscopi]
MDAAAQGLTLTPGESRNGRILTYNSSWGSQFVAAMGGVPELWRSYDAFVEVAASGSKPCPSTTNVLPIANSCSSLLRPSDAPHIWVFVSPTAVRPPASTDSVVSSWPIVAQSSDDVSSQPSSSQWNPQEELRHTLPATTKMKPPPERIYGTVAEAEEAVHSHAFTHGYAVARSNSANAGTSYETVWLRCWLGRSAPQPEKPPAASTSESDDAAAGEPKAKRRGLSRMVGCPFQVRIIAAGAGLFKVVVHEGRHVGHQMQPQIARLMADKLDAEEIELLRCRKREFPTSRPAALLRLINDRRSQLPRPRLHVTNARVISNAIARGRLQERKKTIRLDEVLRRLREDMTEISVEVKTSRRADDDTNVDLDAVFFWHERMSVMVAQREHVVGIDATYQVTEASFPLVQIIGCLPWGKPMLIALALLRHEDTVTLEWVLAQYLTLRPNRAPPQVALTDYSQALMRAVASVMPTTDTLLCHWHASQNVQQQVTKSLAAEHHVDFMNEWKALVEEEDGKESESRWDDLRERWQTVDGGPEVIKYCEETWYSRERWCKIGACHTKAVRHFGFRTTSFVECMHSSLKNTMPSLVQRRALKIPQTIAYLKSWMSQRTEAVSKVLFDQKRMYIWQRTDVAYQQVNTVVALTAILAIRSRVAAARQALKASRDRALDDAADHACTEDINESTVRPTQDPCSAWSAHGLPCVHRLTFIFGARSTQYPQPRQFLLPSDFADFWHLPQALYPAKRLYLQAVPLHETMSAIGTGIVRKFGDFMPPDQARRAEAAVQAFITFDGIERDSMQTPPPSGEATILTPERGRRYLRGRRGKHSAAKRLPTGCERTQAISAAQERRKNTRCGRCGEYGHNRRKCQNKVVEKTGPSGQRKAGPKRKRLSKAELNAALQRGRDGNRDSDMSDREQDRAIWSDAGWSPAPFGDVAPLLSPSPPRSPIPVQDLINRCIEKGLPRPSRSFATSERPQSAESERPQSVASDLELCAVKQTRVQGPLVTTPHGRDVLVEGSVTVEDLLNLCCNGEPETMPADGSCGYHALAHGAGFTDAFSVRQQLIIFLRGEGSDILRQQHGKEAQKVLRSIIPGGRVVTARAADLLRHKVLGSEYWLSVDLLPAIAQMLRRPICVCSQTLPSAWATYLPSGPRPMGEDVPWKGPIGLLHNGTNHWDYIHMKPNGPWPWVALSHLSHFQRPWTCLDRQHKELHTRVGFLIHSIPACKCPCTCNCQAAECNSEEAQSRRRTMFR